MLALPNIFVRTICEANLKVVILGVIILLFMVRVGYMRDY